MRRVVLVGLVVLVCAALSGCTGGGGGGTLPTAEVSAVFDRIEQGVLTENSVMISSCFAPTFESIEANGTTMTVTREQNKEGWDLVFALGDFPEYEIRNRQIAFDGSNRAVVTATIYLESIVLGQWNSSTAVNRWTLQKIDGQWLIVKAEQLA